MKTWVVPSKYVNRITHRELTKSEKEGRYGFHLHSFTGSTWAEVHQKLVEFRREELRAAEKSLKRAKASLEKAESMKEPK